MRAVGYSREGGNTYSNNNPINVPKNRSDQFFFFACGFPNAPLGVAVPRLRPSSDSPSRATYSTVTLDFSFSDVQEDMMTDRIADRKRNPEDLSSSSSSSR